MEEIVKNKESKITTVPIDIDLLEVTNSRMNWKIEELLPVGLVIKEIDETLATASID
jgi:hypothetical protein